MLYSSMLLRAYETGNESETHQFQYFMNYFSFQEETGPPPPPKTPEEKRREEHELLIHKIRTATAADGVGAPNRYANYWFRMRYGLKLGERSEAEQMTAAQKMVYREILMRNAGDKYTKRKKERKAAVAADYAAASERYMAWNSRAEL